MIHGNVVFRVCYFLKSCLRPFVVTAMLFGTSWLGASGQGFKSTAGLTVLAAVRNTADKPQSKVWHYAGKWWAVFPSNTGTYIWRLEGTSWTSALKISSGSAVKADCKVLANLCHILLVRSDNAASQLVSVEYDHISANYKLWSQRPSASSVGLDAGVETGTIDIDQAGRMWLASDGINDIRVRWSDPPYSAWSAPLIIATGVTEDDICGVIALPVKGQIGVLWSDQNSGRFGFKTHNSGAPPSSWSADEVPASQSALNIGRGMGDDHLNMTVASDGTLYCAVKTSYDTPGYPRLALLKRLPSGKWDDLYDVSSSGTRGIVILNEAAGKLKIVYASQEDGGDILYRESSTTNISFSSPLTLIKGVYNNPTSAKASYDPDIVILASDTANHIVGVLGRDSDSITVGFTSMPSEFPVSVYPNPADDLFILEFQEKEVADVSISISDLLGKRYTIANAEVHDHKIEIYLSDLGLNAGLYFLTVQSDKYPKVIRLIKK